MSLTIFIANFSTSTQSSITAYDWCKDIIIPLVGTIGVPLVVWLLTRHYGADKAEERKELRKLRDNLNLILSVCLDAISKLTSLRSSLLKISNIENKKIEEMDNKNPQEIVNILSSYKDIQEILNVFSSPIDFSIINVANYSPCIAYSENYVLDLLKIISALKIKDFKIEHHNTQIKSISDTSDIFQKISKLKEIIEIEAKEFPEFVKEIEKLIIHLRDFIITSKDLENKIKGLKLDDVNFNEEQLALFAEIENLNTKPKEQENDK